MAIAAGWLFIIFFLGMTIGTVKLRVCIIKLKTCHQMPELAVIPIAMADNTIGIQFSDFFTSRMAGPALQLLMESI